MALVNWTSAFQLTPAGTDAMSVVDDRINELKEQVARRGEQGGHGYYDDPNSVGHGLTPAAANDGRHVIDSGGSGIGPDIYLADGTTKMVTYSVTGAAMASGQTWSGPNVTTGENPGHGHDVTVVVYLPQVATGLVSGVIYHNLGNGAITLIECKLQCWTAPGAGGLSVDINKLDNTHGDPADLATPPNDGTVFTVIPTIASGLFLGAAATIDAAKDELAVGEAWVF